MNTLLISVSQVLARLAREQRVLFVDCRAVDSWDRSDLKLPGAIRAAPDSLPAVAERLASCEGVVAYGERGWEASALELVQHLRDRGTADARILSGGLSAWMAEGLPTESTHTAHQHD